MKAKIVLCDDEGNVLSDSSSTAHAFELGGQTLNEIEQAIEQGVSKGSGMHGSKKNGSRTIDPVPEPKNYHAPTIAIANRASP
ncbi:hypothetical protein HRE53_33205 (plasmid) [Acaryochloris sp. 'Moss Beach']|uniref:hypothetical protein n=1 Tax=Acaryochloris sp. 'Moss Beach' TaxID=2740837 RepID=UPI001F24BE6D|nr:hypothetical protein [Acaryochloris sp. 'Moss Beach']UJB73445.1 hypothetical protein HRE53_33205 [Acaryochloris sp. 'Moss Beach']